MNSKTSPDSIFRDLINCSEDDTPFPALDNLTRLLSSLPGIGQRSAMRIAFHLIKQEHLADQLSEAFKSLRETIRFCEICGGLTEKNICDICSDQKRLGALCVVEEPGDILSIERTGEFQGHYHVLMGALSPLDGIGPEDLRLDELNERLASGRYTELFIATNPTLEGDATAHYLTDRFGRTGVRITRISHGIPTGSTIEYADTSTLARSIRGRTHMQD